jgi:hypothetical protein
MCVQVAIALACAWWGQAAVPPAPSDQAAEGLEVRYARAQLQLAEANLQRVEQINKRLARSVPSSVVADYQQDAQVARRQLQQSLSGQPSSDFQVWIGRAQAEWKTAETYWKNATAVNARSPGSFEALDIERFRLRAEVARLQMDRGEALVDASREAQLQWEVELLNNQVQRLKEETSRLTPFVRYYPYRRW